MNDQKVQNDDVPITFHFKLQFSIQEPSMQPLYDRRLACVASQRQGTSCFSSFFAKLFGANYTTFFV